MSIDLFQIARTLLRNTRFLIIAAAVGLAAGVIYLHFAHYKYAVTLEVMPIQSGSSGSGVSGMLGSLSGLANLAGVNLPVDNNARQLDLYVEQLTSPDVARDMLDQQAIAKVVFADRWDDATKSWKKSRGFVSTVLIGVKALLGIPVRDSVSPSVEDMRQLIETDVQITNQRGEPTAKITYSNADPYFAKMFLLALHHAADERLRRRMLDRTTKYIDYVNRQLQTSTSADERQALIQTLTEQERARMFASANVSYSVEIFSDPIASFTSVSPQPGSTLITFAALGLLAGIATVLAMSRFGTVETGDVTTGLMHAVFRSRVVQRRAVTVDGRTPAE